MSEGLFDLLYVIDSIITSTLKVFVIIVVLKLMKKGAKNDSTIKSIAGCGKFLRNKRS